MHLSDSQNRHPREQAQRIVRRITQDGQLFCGALVGKRREGKTDLLHQVHRLLFEAAEGPIPVFFSAAAVPDHAALARQYLAAFCQQVRAFVMRQDDMLLEPAAGLEAELQRAGLPLSLSEMSRTFLTLAPSQQFEYAAALAAQFARREARPLCLLFDDVEALPPNSALLRGLVSPYLSWIVTGRQRFVSRIAGAGAWPIIRLEPFSRDAAVSIAARLCRAAEITFFEEVWQQWYDVAGPSPWLLECIVQAAATRGEPLDSIEQLGRVYFQELSAGSLGNWLASRLEQAVPGRLDRVAAMDWLATVATAGISALIPNQQLADGLIAEEWAEESTAGPRVVLDALQRDWLLIAASADVPIERSRVRALQDFLLRVRRLGKRRSSEPLLNALRARLASLAQTGLPKVFDSDWLQMHPPRISSVAREFSGTGELFWCYGVSSGTTESAETIFVLLIVLCEDAPASAQLDGWFRQWHKEIRLLQHLDPGPQARHELWLLLPPGASLEPVRSERRCSWETFARLLDLKPTRQADPV